MYFPQSYGKKRAHASFRATILQRKAKRKAIGFAYSLKRSRTMTPRASAMVCKRHSEGSLRPLQNCLMAWGDMPNFSANSTQLMFFPSSLFAAEAATHTFAFSYSSLLFKSNTWGRFFQTFGDGSFLFDSLARVCCQTKKNRPRMFRPRMFEKGCSPL